MIEGAYGANSGQLVGESVGPSIGMARAPSQQHDVEVAKKAVERSRSYLFNC